VNKFAQPILDRIADQPPDFEEDFSGSNSSLRLSLWVPEENRGEQNVISDYISDGALKLDMQSGAVYQIYGDVINRSNFALQFDVLPVTGIEYHVVEFRQSDSGSYELQLGLCCEEWDWGIAKYTESGGGHGEHLGSGESEEIAYQKNINVLLIAQGNQFAVYLNGKPTVHIQDDGFQNGNIFIRLGAGDVAGHAEIDNLKFWDLDPPWVSEFAQPILDTIEDQTPYVEEDFSGSNSSLSLSLYVPEENRGEQLLISDYISDGALKLDMQPGSHYHLESSMLNSTNFALEFDVLPITGIQEFSVEFRQSDSGSYAFQLGACCEAWDLTKSSGSVSERLVYGESEVIAYQKIIKVLLIVQGDQFAIYLNGQPLEHIMDDEIRYGGNFIWLGTDVLGGQAEFDNLKFWRLDDL